MNEELNSEEERVLDVLLSELHGASGPRDFTQEIISHLNFVAADQGQSIAPSVRVAKTRPRSKKSAMWVLAPLVIGLAACVLIVAMYGRTKHPQPNLSQPIAANSRTAPTQPDRSPSTDRQRLDQWANQDSARNDSLAVATSNAAPSNVPQDDFPQHGFEPANAAERIANASPGIPLAADSKSGNTTALVPDAVGKTRPTPPALPSLPVRLVSQHVDEEMRAYWRNSQIEPTGDAPAEVISERIAKLLGVDVPADMVRDVERLQIHLSQPNAASSIATHWLNAVTMNGFGRMGEDDQQILRSSFARAIVSRKGFDQVIADLIAGKSSASSSWYNALASTGEAAMHHRLASVSMNADLRCTRCHDAFDDSKGLQQDHWSFVAVLKSRIRLNETEGRWEVVDSDAGRRNQFYDLLDGRSRIAKPSISPKWMGVDSADSVSTLDQWAENLVGSRPLADGIVNSLWRTIYGRSLVGSSFEAADLPSQKPLQRLQKELSDDLIASGFDVSRTLALMVQAPSFQRSVPRVLETQTSSLVRRDELEQANQLVNVFAAAPAQTRLGMHKKAAYVLRSVGSKIALPDDAITTVLGQAEVINPKQNRNPSQRRAALSSELPVDFPTAATESPLPWLDQMNDVDAKISHLAYLSGRSVVPPFVETAVKAMREAKTDEALILERVSWLLTN